MAVISDIHANLPALEAVLADIKREGVHAIWCLGDLVGYGAQPDECVELAARECAIVLVGNHDLAVLDRLDISTFSPAAAAAVRWTREVLGSDSRAYLDGLSPTDASQAIGLFHGSPRDPVWEYVLTETLADDCMTTMIQRVGAIGHSHLALAFKRKNGGRAKGESTPAGTEVDLAAGDFLLNPGAVGQPRDGDPRAAWLALDLVSWTAAWKRSEYEIDEAAEAIREAGLPPALADRLYYGQ